MQKRQNQRALNHQIESLTLAGTKTQRRRKYKEIIKELGQRNISFKDIAGDISDSPKYKGFLDMLKSNPGFTFDDVVILQQYARAITEGDTKAATFLRDTAEGSPKQQIDITSDNQGLSQLSYEELISLRDTLASSHNRSTPTPPTTE